jgi:TetR/AcrR family transcriptional regulator, transcriptional repressor for nem operon
MSLQGVTMSHAPTRKELTHERIVDAAATIIRRSGYDGTGVADIMKEAGLTHGGFYAHFDSRTQLLAEAADRAGAKSMERMRKVTDRAAPRDALQAFVDTYLSDAHLDSPGTGCSLAALGSEMPRQSAEVRKVCARRLKDMVDLVERQLPDWGRPGQHEKALAIMSCLVGAMVLARAADDKRIAKDVRNAAKALIQKSLA